MPRRLAPRNDVELIKEKRYLKTMFDDDTPKPTTAEFPRDLENMSVEEIEEYIADMKEEIVRAEADITQKRASMNAADAFFKS